MNETTTMLANVIRLTIGDLPWSYRPQLAIEDKIKQIINKNLEKELIGYDEDGNEQYKLGNPKNKELDEVLNMLLIIVDKDKAEISRYQEGKVEVLENKFKTIKKIVDKYSDIEEEI